jgi:hypothetical protein
MIKNYKKVYNENYNVDIITSDFTKKKTNVIEWNPEEDYSEEVVHKIVICDIDCDLGMYSNLERSFGGQPRLDKKNNFNECWDDSRYKVSPIEMIQKRHSKKNGYHEVTYFVKNKGYGLIWKDGKVICVELNKDDMEAYNNEPEVLDVLHISAKKLKVYKDKDDSLKPEIKKLRKMRKLSKVFK